MKVVVAIEQYRCHFNEARFGVERDVSAIAGSPVTLDEGQCAVLFVVQPLQGDPHVCVRVLS